MIEGSFTKSPVSSPAHGLAKTDGGFSERDQTAESPVSQSAAEDRGGENLVQL